MQTKEAKRTTRTPRSNIDAMDKCSICMNMMTSHYHELACTHRFHHSCIKELFCIYMDDRCPLCRTNYKYQPSKKRKAKRTLRNKILKHHTNAQGIMTRIQCANMHYYFVSRKISMPFLKRMGDVLRTRGDYNFIRYTRDIISLYKIPYRNSKEELCYQNRDLKQVDFHKQEMFRRYLYPVQEPEPEPEEEEDEAEDEEWDPIAERAQLNQEGLIYAIADTYDLNVFHIQQIFRAFTNFRRELEILEEADNSGGPELMHEILLHILDGWDRTTTGQDYNNDVRICNMYNVEQDLLDQLIQTSEGASFNIAEIENTAAEIGYLNNLQDWVRAKLFELVIDYETHILWGTHDFDDLVGILPHDSEYEDFLIKLRDEYQPINGCETFMQSASGYNLSSHNGDSAFTAILTWWGNNRHGLASEQNRRIKRVVDKYDLPLAYVTQIFNQFDGFSDNLETLEDDHLNNIELVRSILQHVLDTDYDSYLSEDYDDDVRVCNMYNVDENLLG